MLYNPRTDCITSCNSHLARSTAQFWLRLSRVDEATVLGDPYHTLHLVIEIPTALLLFEVFLGDIVSTLLACTLLLYEFRTVHMIRRVSATCWSTSSSLDFL